jgi:A-kinase anchor protein 9
LLILLSLHLIFHFTLLQGIGYQAAMDCLQKADRRSLLSEIQALHAQINGRKMALKREQEIDKPSQGILYDRFI